MGGFKTLQGQHSSVDKKKESRKETHVCKNITFPHLKVFCGDFNANSGDLPFYQLWGKDFS